MISIIDGKEVNHANEELDVDVFRGMLLMKRWTIII
ncbi:hypothetical protein ZOSMA_160G00080 [Zostera marina]|uniref:Uncharacterized protein n=1 Tax=Zostera marina TaxID=29655 RepID=A0A0K9PUN1_ZOSMR|nr:hypothetical protein ZOSMA_160G00080 [Zostera marina]